MASSAPTLDPSAGIELKNLSEYFEKAQTRLDAADALSKATSKLSDEIARYVIREYPEAAKASNFLFAPSSDIEVPSFREDIGVFLRLIAYCLVAGDINPLESDLADLLQGVTEAVRSSSALSMHWYCAGLRYLKRHHGFPHVIAAEVNACIDNILLALN